MSNTARKTVTYKIKKWTSESFMVGRESGVYLIQHALQRSAIPSLTPTAGPKDQFNCLFHEVAVTRNSDGYQMTWTGGCGRGNLGSMSVSRGKFLKALGKSIPGMVLGGGAATAAQKFLGKIAAASGAPEIPTSNAKPFTPKNATIEFIKNGPSRGNRIALTFDDGPTPRVTDSILDELKKRKLRATFFMIGERVATAPDLARRVLAEGHEVGNHTYTHPKLTTLSDAQADVEIEKTQQIMYSVLGHRPELFRPPYGALRQNQACMLTRKGLRIVLWGLDSGDWAQPGTDKIAAKILTDAQSGSIILCHDVYQQTVDGIGPILDGLLERGFTLVTLSQLLE
jgi:peptidoglycan-N-acetylglucosamine deacetylase